MCRLGSLNESAQCCAYRFTYFSIPALASVLEEVSCAYRFTHWSIPALASVPVMRSFPALAVIVLRVWAFEPRFAHAERRPFHKSCARSAL